MRERTSVFLFFRDIKNNVGIVPLALVFRKAQLAALHMPDHFLVWNKFCDLLPAGSVLVASSAKGVTRVLRRGLIRGQYCGLIQGFCLCGRELSKVRLTYLLPTASTEAASFPL